MRRFRLDVFGKCLEKLNKFKDRICIAGQFEATFRRVIIGQVDPRSTKIVDLNLGQICWAFEIEPLSPYIEKFQRMIYDIAESGIAVETIKIPRFHRKPLEYEGVRRNTKTEMTRMILILVLAAGFGVSVSCFVLKWLHKYSKILLIYITKAWNENLYEKIKRLKLRQRRK